MHRRPPPSRAAATPPQDARRDGVVDLWRGLALVDMAWVHLLGHGLSLPGALDPWLREHLRFAAGAFVFIAGLGVATAFLPTLNAGGTAALRARHALWRRALLLLVLDRAVAVARVALEGLLPPSSDAVPPSISALLLLREPGVTGGLLLLYAALLAATPALAAIARRTGWGAIALATAAAYAVAVHRSTPSSDAAWSFPLAFWHPFFVAGLVSAPAWLWLREGPARRRAAWLAIAAFAFAGFTAARSGALGLAPLGWSFVKVPLLPAEMLRYALAMQLVFAATALACVAGGGAVRRGAGVLRMLGRNSLAVYVAHLFVEVPLVDAIWQVGPTPVRVFALLALDVAALAAVALAAERLARRAHPKSARWRAPWPRLPEAVVVGAASVVVSAAALVGTRAMAPSPVEMQAAMPEEAGDEMPLERAPEEDPLGDSLAEPPAGV